MKKAILLILLLPMLASAQYFDVFDIDTSEYPIMKAKFYSIDANGKQILNHTPADFEITENGEPRDVISVSCPEPSGDPFSVVIAVDVSGSMSGNSLSILKNSIKYFIDLVPNNGSEVAIIAFNSGNYYVSDFSTNKSQLKAKIEGLNVGGGTDFNAAFINPVAGALLAMDKAKNQKKSIVLVTDGYASGNETEIINNAKSKNTRIYSIIIGAIAPKILSNISQATEGKTYNDVITESDFNEAFINVRNEILGEPCDISWKSNLTCENSIKISIKNKRNGLTNAFNIRISDYQIVRMESNPYFIKFRQLSQSEVIDTTITITAQNNSQVIKDITFEPNLGYFEFITPLPIKIDKGKSIDVIVRYNAIDTSKQYSKLTLITENCDFQLGLLGGTKNGTLSNRTLSLTHPNGGEEFVAGSDTLIKWEGISDEEKVQLEFSKDSGKIWENVSRDATNGVFEWKIYNINSDSCLIRVGQYTKKAGDLEWEKSYGGSFNDRANSIIQTKDGGYIVAGTSDSHDGHISNSVFAFDYWIVKLDLNGDLEWEKSYGGSGTDIAYSIIQTTDGGYIVVGQSNSNNRDKSESKGSRDYWIVKLDLNGDLEWERSYGGSNYEEAYSIKQSSDGGYIIAGLTQSSDGDISEKKLNHDYWIVKLDQLGNLDWEKSYGGSGSDVANSIIQTYDGGFIVVGYSESKDGDKSEFKGNSDYWIVKLDQLGNLDWEKSYGGSGGEAANSIIQSYDGSYVIAGLSSSFDGDKNEFKGRSDYWIVKLDQLGNLDWEKSYGGSVIDYATSIAQTNDGGYIVAGETQSSDGDLSDSKGYQDYWIVKLDPLGNLEWEKSYGGSGSDVAKSIIQTNDGGYIVAGFTNSLDGDITNSKGFDDFWVLKISPPPQPLQSDTSDAVFSIIMPEPVIQNNDIDMGEMIVGSTKDTIVSSVICNTGDAPLHVLGVDITGGDAGDFLIPRGAGDFYLNKGECQDMMFEFAPSALGNRTAVATIRTTIGDFKDTIHIRGVGIAPVIEATSEVVDFGVFELGNGKDTTVVLVKNVGSTDITITDTRISGPDMEQFTLNLAPTNFTIAAGEEKEFQLNYTAKYGGKSNSFLDFHFDGIGSPIRSLLFAEGIGGEVYPQVADAYVGETVNLGIFLGKIKPEGLSEVATNFSTTVSYNSTLLAPIDKSMLVTTKDDKSFITIAGELSGVPQIATVPMKVGLGTDDRSGLVITEFQLYDANGDSVDYDIEPGVGEFNVLGICEEGGKRLINPNGEVIMQVVPENQFGNARVSLKLIETGQTEIEIYDQIGNKVETVYSGTPSAGQQEINLDLSKYANGRYYIKLTTPTITKTEIIEVVR